MFAVERLDHRVMEGTGLEIIREHRRPRDCLEKCPMPAEHHRQRENNKDSANSGKHDQTVEY